VGAWRRCCRCQSCPLPGCPLLGPAALDRCLAGGRPMGTPDPRPPSTPTRALCRVLQLSCIATAPSRCPKSWRRRPGLCSPPPPSTPSSLGQARPAPGPWPTPSPPRSQVCLGPSASVVVVVVVVAVAVGRPPVLCCPLGRTPLARGLQLVWGPGWGARVVAGVWGPAPAPAGTCRPPSWAPTRTPVLGPRQGPAK
jgi:hypothetical protein